MIDVLAIANYRSLLRLALPMGRLTVVTGANGSGKSNLYRALRLLAETGRGGVVRALAREGGLESTLWAGPEDLSRRMRSGEVGVAGGPRSKTVRLRLGFVGKDLLGEDLGYSIALGLPPPSSSAFALDPEIKHEAIWAGPVARPASLLVERKSSMVRSREDREWKVIAGDVSAADSLFDQTAHPAAMPEVHHLREAIRRWRFYDQFRTDPDALARQPRLGTRTPILHHDGRDLAAALQTVREIGDREALERTVADAFPGSRLEVVVREDGRFAVELEQEGLLRPLQASELSDGTLRFLLWTAALLTPRPPPLMVVNEPETSLHPDLIPALARLLVRASRETHVWVVSHSARLVSALQESETCRTIELTKELGATAVVGQRSLDEPPWSWPD
ncbi:MAG TPA: AAA family ATPase [Thermoanaerobaculia bacterium]|nr:AAA family ATPase [Thermoanaerobaculia bacterium]